MTNKITMAKTDYEVLKESVAKKVKDAGGSRHSRSDLISMATTLLNTPEQEVKTYVKDVKDPVVTKPVERYRESLKPVIKQFGVDSAELDKIKDVKFSKEHAEALVDLGTQITKDYIDTGRKMIFPINDKDEAQMEIQQVSKSKKVEETKKIVETSPGKYESVPTGKRKTTEAHKEIKASNKVPSWLVETKDI